MKVSLNKELRKQISKLSYDPEEMRSRILQVFEQLEDSGYYTGNSQILGMGSQKLCLSLENDNVVILGKYDDSEFDTTPYIIQGWEEHPLFVKVKAINLYGVPYVVCEKLTPFTRDTFPLTEDQLKPYELAYNEVLDVEEFDGIYCNFGLDANNNIKHFDLG